MTDRIKLSFWNYNDFDTYTPQMLKDWADCGMTASMSPLLRYGVHSNEEFKTMLDYASELGISILVQIDRLMLEHYYNGADEYRAFAEKVYDEFGCHPAVCGFYVGEEPNVTTNEAYHEGIKILREVMGELDLFINLGSIERTERMLLKGEKSIDQWCVDFAKYSNANIIGYGTYSQLMNGGYGIDEHFFNIRGIVNAGKRAGTDIWSSLLSSAHYNYRVPTEDDYRWQINTAVACGCKAVVWFRLYDKLIAFDYHGSPIDEFGEKTTHYYDLARVQKRFNAHHAEIFARLNHVNTYGVGVSYGGYLYFVQGVSDLVETAMSRSAMLSFFKDDDGNDYIAVVNTLMDESCCITLNFSEKVESADLVYLNGEKLINCCTRDGKSGQMPSGEIWLAPGQMELLKLN